MCRTHALVIYLVTAAPALAAPAAGKERHILLDVQPAAAPIPALKYQLLPQYAELNPGNAVPAYLKCFAEQNNFFFKKESVDEREHYQKCPLSDIKPGALKNYGGHALRQADFAARLEYCDWNTLPQMREHGYALLIPEVQQMRLLASALAVRCRGELVDKNYDAAVHTLKTIFVMARHMGEHPTVISGLVGNAIASIGLNLVEEFIQQPDAPNMFWALTDLPNQFVDLRNGTSAERMLTEATFGALLNRQRVWSADDMQAAAKKLMELGVILEFSAAERTAADEWLRARVKDDEWLKMARKSLVEAGYPGAVVPKYPPEQVLLQHLLRLSREQHDEASKWMAVPYWQAEAALIEMEKTPMEIEDRLTRQIVFAVPKVRAAHLRSEQRLAMLRVVEAIRLHAARNSGKLPASLSELGVPLPNDPVTGKAFAYTLDGLTGRIDATPTRVTGGANFKYSYEVRLRK